MTESTILFDLDGTLTDPKDGITRCIAYALKTLGRPVPEQSALLWCIGPPLAESFKRLLNSGSDDQVAEALRLYRERFNRKGKFENRVYPDIPESLAALRQSGARLYVATSKPAVFAKQITDHFDLTQYFEKIYGSELNGDLSDKAELIDHIIQTETLDPLTTMMVGDRHHDMVGAKRNDIKAIGVTFGYGSTDELLQAGADAIVDSPRALASII